MTPVKYNYQNTLRYFFHGENRKAVAHINSINKISKYIVVAVFS